MSSEIRKILLTNHYEYLEIRAYGDGFSKNLVFAYGDEIELIRFENGSIGFDDDHKGLHTMDFNNGRSADDLKFYDDHITYVANKNHQIVIFDFDTNETNYCTDSDGIDTSGAPAIVETRYDGGDSMEIRVKGK